MDNKFSELLGKTLKEVKGLDKGSELVTFICEDGSVYDMYHSQDCCESVSVEDVTGDRTNLIDSPITFAEEVSNSETHPEDYKPNYQPESFTWTFYKLATVKGYVTIRWLGESNGYYSESVSFIKKDVQN